jgi:hypothetical protein
MKTMFLVGNIVLAGLRIQVQENETCRFSELLSTLANRIKRKSLQRIFITVFLKTVLILHFTTRNVLLPGEIKVFLI